MVSICGDSKMLKWDCGFALANWRKTQLHEIFGVRIEVLEVLKVNRKLTYESKVLINCEGKFKKNTEMNFEVK